MPADTVISDAAIAPVCRLKERTQGMICNGGVCDACPVWGGVTTEEEMFGVLGAYYVVD